MSKCDYCKKEVSIPPGRKVIFEPDIETTKTAAPFEVCGSKRCFEQLAAEAKRTKCSTFEAPELDDPPPVVMVPAARVPLTEAVRKTLLPGYLPFDPLAQPGE